MIPNNPTFDRNDNSATNFYRFPFEDLTNKDFGRFLLNIDPSIHRVEWKTVRTDRMMQIQEFILSRLRYRKILRVNGL